LDFRWDWGYFVYIFIRPSKNSYEIYKTVTNWPAQIFSIIFLSFKYPLIILLAGAKNIKWLIKDKK
jgi:hypothetical protein